MRSISNSSATRLQHPWTRLPGRRFCEVSRSAEAHTTSCGASVEGKLRGGDGKDGKMCSDLGVC